MGTMLVTIKMMPSSPEADIEKIKEGVTKLLESNEAQNPKFETQDVAFGLKALVISFGWPEEKEFEEFENKLREVENVGSSETIDLRRAVG